MTSYRTHACAILFALALENTASMALAAPGTTGTGKDNQSTESRARTGDVGRKHKSLAYPELFTPEHVPADPDHPSPTDNILIHAAMVQKEYAEDFRKSARYSDVLQLPIIGAAALAAGILYNNGSHALNHLAGIGIGVGGYTGFRSTLFPTSLPQIYLAGYSALSCVRVEAVGFTGQSAEERFKHLQENAAELAAAIQEAKEVARSSRLSGSPAESELESYQQSTLSLSEAVAAATAALTSANKQIAAHETSEVVFGTAVANVQLKVAAASRKGRISDFADIKRMISDSMAAAGASSTPPASGTGKKGFVASTKSDRENLINLLQSATTELVRLTQEITSTMPNYSGALERVAACPSVVG